MAYLLEPTPLDPKFQKRLRPLRHHMLPVSFAFFLSLSLSKRKGKGQSHPDLALEECLHPSGEVHLRVICPECRG